MSQQVLDAPPVSQSLRPLADCVGELQQRVETNRRRWRTVILFEALGLALAVPLAYLWTVFFLDGRLHLPMMARLLASLGLLAGLAWAARHLWSRWRSLDLGQDQVALAIEGRTPTPVHNRLINAVQLARRTQSSEVYSRDLSEAVIRENHQRLHEIHLEEAAQMRPALLRMGLAGALVVLGIAFWIWQPAWFANAAARIFLPLASIEPLYRTRLAVEPGDVETTGNVTLRITIAGERPETLTLLKRQQGKLISEVIPVPAEADAVETTLRDITQPFTYAVRGGDYTTPYYQVTLPSRAGLARLRVFYRYPAYTKLADRTVESAASDLEALAGTQAKATFVFDHPVEEAKLVLDQPAGAKQQAVQLTKLGLGREWQGDIALVDVVSYWLEVVHKQPQKLGPFAIRLLRDQEPKLELTGLDQRAEINLDGVLPLQVIASDDYGLETMGLYYRKLQTTTRLAHAENNAAKANDAEAWTAIAAWPGEQKTTFRSQHAVTVASLGLVEGDKIELAVRAVDNDPLKKGAWTTGAIYELTVGGDGVALQLLYEQILRSERDLKALVKSEHSLLANVVAWQRKLEGAGNIKWEDPKNIAELHAAVGDLQKTHEKLRQSAGQLARSMVPQAGNLRVAIGMLADTEMMRLTRILDSVPTREQPQAKQAALADGRVTLDRILRSLDEIQETYVTFRADWELGNMVPFTKMLADRQTKLRDQSRQRVGKAAEPGEPFLRPSMQKRQTKVLELCQLIQPAFLGLAARLEEPEAILAKAFQAGAATLGGESLQKPLRQGADDAGAGRWQQAAAQQTVAAEMLAMLHHQLRQAQMDAAQKALAALRDKAKSDLKAQQELEKLDPGTDQNFVKNFPDNFKLEDLMRIQEVAGTKKRTLDKEDKDLDSMFLLDVDKKRIELDKDSGVRQDPYSLTLGKVAEPTPILKMYKDKEGNKVQPFMQEQFDDLVGKLLEEADELDKKYQSIKLSTNQNNNDPGDIGKVGGALNSTGAVTATGNKKPPTTESGGVSRTGRQGARAYGMVADEETFNRKGRDQALDGQEKIADQAGLNKMHKTDENQKDTSTGVGGKKIASDDTHFSLHDTGKWKDEYTKRLEKPQAKENIVERQGDKLDPKVAAQMRDLTSKQEQIIERLKAIKKDLKNLYLPTEHLDELMQTLQTNLESLNERPEAELFRLQAQALEHLRGALRVFRHASASFQPSLPRDRQVRGRVLDEPATPALPGYEEATKGYYLRLANQ